MASLVNNKRTDLSFNVGDQVLLSTTNITVANQANRPSHKLAPCWTGPFSILERVGPVAYRLDLPSTLPIHPVIHISKPRPYSDPLSFNPSCDVPPRPPPDIIADLPEWEVEAILYKR